VLAISLRSRDDPRAGGEPLRRTSSLPPSRRAVPRAAVDAASASIKPGGARAALLKRVRKRWAAADSASGRRAFAEAGRRRSAAGARRRRDRGLQQCLDYHRGLDDLRRSPAARKENRLCAVAQWPSTPAIRHHQQGINLNQGRPASLALVRPTRRRPGSTMQVATTCLATTALRSRRLRLAEAPSERSATSIRAHASFGRGSSAGSATTVKALEKPRQVSRSLRITRENETVLCDSCACFPTSRTPMV